MNLVFAAVARRKYIRVGSAPASMLAKATATNTKFMSSGLVGQQWPTMARFVLVFFLIFSQLLISCFSVAGEFVASKQRVQLQQLSDQELSTIKSLNSASLSKLITVNLLDEQNNSVGQVWGQVDYQDGEIIFTPRFPFDDNQHYQASYQLGIDKFSEPVQHNFSFARANQQPLTRVTQVYPSGDVLPENLFKFYIHFSRPMSRGEAYQHVSLLDQDQRKVELPFLELAQELWDPSGQRFTLLFDPGRTKKGIKPNRDMGLPLQQGKTFTLVIDEHWRDAEGLSLQSAFRKSFTVGPQDTIQPAIGNWRLSLPGAGSVDAMVVSFDEPLDFAQLENAIWIEAEDGDLVGGELAIENELEWRYTPMRPWQPGRYRLVAKSYLEDQAANSLGRAFEVIRGNEDPIIPDVFVREFTLSK